MGRRPIGKGSLASKSCSPAFLFTNGLLQTQNQHSTLFSRDRLATLLRQRPGATPAEIIRDVVRQVTQFSGEAPQSNDVTFLALRYHGR